MSPFRLPSLLMALLILAGCTQQSPNTASELHSRINQPVTLHGKLVGIPDSKSPEWSLRLADGTLVQLDPPPKDPVFGSRIAVQGTLRFWQGSPYNPNDPIWGYVQTRRPSVPPGTPQQEYYLIEATILK